MSIKDRKKKENFELRQKILNAALKVFADQGYAEVSMRKIAGLIDYSATTIYRFFRNKEELLGAIAIEAYKDLSAKVEKIKAQGGGDHLAMLKLLIREYIIFCVERPEMFRLLADLSVFEMDGDFMYERLGHARFQVYQSWFACIHKSIEADVLDVKDEKRVFLYLWDSVNGYIDHLVNQPRIPRKPLSTDAAEYLNLLFRGLEAKKTDAKRR